MKRIFAVIAAIAVMLFMAACDPDNPNKGPDNTPPGKTNITLWTFPVGGWGNSSTVSEQISAFNLAYPNIRVSVEYIDYATGDARVEEALKNGTAPDLILEGPERLVANWGARGLMADITDLWQDDKAKAIRENVSVACHDEQGKYYIYPMCMTTHCMAINRDLFEAAGALQYIDEATHTWTTENFFKAVEAIKNYQPSKAGDPAAPENVAAVYCGGQGGDQGTRALITNLYSGTFTDPTHKTYTVDSEENIRALTELKATDGIIFADDMVGTDEITAFCSGELAMSLCWNVSVEISQTINKTLNFDVFPMEFPTDDGKVELQGGIWGFGIFDSGDEERIEAAKAFIEFMMKDDAKYSSAVIASTYWPVRDMPDIYVNDKIMNEYGIFSKDLGDYYQIAPDWADARTAWWQMLQRIGKGDDVAECVGEFSEKANGKS